MFDTNIATLINSLRLNINLVYISYHAVNVKLPKTIVIADYEMRFDKLQDSLEKKDIVCFKEWIADPINEDVTKDYITQVSVIELKNIAIEIGTSKIDAIDKSWNNLFNVYKGYIDSNS